jgi:hypothetical protein
VVEDRHLAEGVHAPEFRVARVRGAQLDVEALGRRLHDDAADVGRAAEPWSTIMKTSFEVVSVDATTGAGPCHHGPFLP